MSGLVEDAFDEEGRETVDAGPGDESEIRRRLLRTDESRALTVRYGVHEHLERFRREAAQAGGG